MSSPYRNQKRCRVLKRFFWKSCIVYELSEETFGYWFPRQKNCKFNVSVSMVLWFYNVSFLAYLSVYVFFYKTVIQKVVTIWLSNLGNTIQYITPYQPIIIQKHPKIKIVALKIFEAQFKKYGLPKHLFARIEIVDVFILNPMFLEVQ